MSYRIFIVCLFLTLRLTAQENKSNQNYEVSGMIQDSTNLSIPGVTVQLVSVKDTLKVSTDSEGIFFFPQLKSPVFTLTISHLGFTTTYRKYLFTDANKRLVLDPIVLKSDAQMLDEVSIKGKIGIVYKKDTVEYRASDYKVRAYANLGELLKKMEGVEVSKSGEVSHNGEKIAGAKFNGKRYFDGNIAEAIKEMPADIVERIQIIDDYGEQAELTGIKSGQAVKMLNVVSKSDKSVGNLGELAAEAGNNKRYGLQASARQINGTRQLGLKAILNQNQAGVASPESANTTGISGGIIQRKAIDLILSNQLNKKSNFELGYKFDRNINNNDRNDSSTELFDQGTINSLSINKTTTTSNSHRVNGKITYKINPSNQLITTGRLSHNGQVMTNLSSIVRSGLIQITQDQNYNQHSNATLYNLSALFLHTFKSNKQILSMEVKYNNDHIDLTKDEINHLLYDNAKTSLEKDSLLHLNTSSLNRTHTFNSKAVYAQPLSDKQKLTFNISLNKKDYNNNKIVSHAKDDQTKPVDSLSNAFHYSFTESQMSTSYRYEDERLSWSIGVSAVPIFISGQSPSLGSSFKHSNINLTPVFDFNYNISRQSQVSIYYRPFSNHYLSNCSPYQTLQIRKTQLLETQILKLP